MLTCFLYMLKLIILIFISKDNDLNIKYKCTKIFFIIITKIYMYMIILEFDISTYYK